MSFSSFIWKVLFSGNTHFIHFLLEYKDGYSAQYKDFITYCAPDKISVKLETFWKFGISFKEYLLPKGWVRMFNINLKMSLIAILWPLHWLCWCCRSLVLRNENADTLASCNFTKDPFPLLSLVWHSHLLWSCYKPNILWECILLLSQTFSLKNLKCEHINNFILISWGWSSIQNLCWERVNKFACMKQNSCNLQRYVFTL